MSDEVSWNICIHIERESLHVLQYNVLCGTRALYHSVRIIYNMMDVLTAYYNEVVWNLKLCSGQTHYRQTPMCERGHAGGAC